jgi:hypothetical protein
VDRATATLQRLRRLALPMSSSIAAIDDALPAARALLDAAGVDYRIVGGAAVVHHGHARLTDDVDVLLAKVDQHRLDPLLAAHGFARESPARLRHVASGVTVDFLPAGDPMPRPGDPPYPSVVDVGTSEDDTRVASLRGLIELKLRARRHQDHADIVALLKPLDEARYLVLESSVDVTLRRALSELWRDAQEELRWK